MTSDISLTFLTNRLGLSLENLWFSLSLRILGVTYYSEQNRHPPLIPAGIAGT